MADPDHLAELEKGVKNWNTWRKRKGIVDTDLSEVKFYDRDFRGANFWRTNFIGARLYKTKFQEANLNEAKLHGAYLESAEFPEASLIRAELNGADLREADLRDTRLSNADLSDANIMGVKYDNKMRCRNTNVSSCCGSQRFVRHVKDLDYLEEFKEKYPVKHFAWSYTSDCGRCWELLFVWCVFIIGLFAIFFDWAGTQRPLISSIMAFTSFGFVDASAHSTGEFVLTCVEAMLGFTMFGCLVSLISSMMARRSG